MIYPKSLNAVRHFTYKTSLQLYLNFEGDKTEVLPEIPLRKTSYAFTSCGIVAC